MKFFKIILLLLMVFSCSQERKNQKDVKGGVVTNDIKEDISELHAQICELKEKRYDWLEENNLVHNLHVIKLICAIRENNHSYLKQLSDLDIISLQDSLNEQSYEHLLIDIILFKNSFASTFLDKELFLYPKFLYLTKIDLFNNKNFKSSEFDFFVTLKPGFSDSSILKKFIDTGRIKVLSAFLDLDVLRDLDEKIDGKTALIYALEEDRLEIARILINSGANGDQVYRNQKASTYLKNQKKKDEVEKTQVIKALENYDTSLLNNRNIDLVYDFESCQKCTPLFYAISVKSSKLIKEILSLGASKILLDSAHERNALETLLSLEPSQEKSEMLKAFLSPSDEITYLKHLVPIMAKGDLSSYKVLFKFHLKSQEYKKIMSKVYKNSCGERVINESTTLHKVFKLSKEKSSISSGFLRATVESMQNELDIFYEISKKTTSCEDDYDILGLAVIAKVRLILINALYSSQKGKYNLDRKVIYNPENDYHFLTKSYSVLEIAKQYGRIGTYSILTR